MQPEMCFSDYDGNIGFLDDYGFQNFKNNEETLKSIPIVLDGESLYTDENKIGEKFAKELNIPYFKYDYSSNIKRIDHIREMLSTLFKIVDNYEKEDFQSKTSFKIVDSSEKEDFQEKTSTFAKKEEHKEKKRNKKCNIF